jgi:hypothetical protein
MSDENIDIREPQLYAGKPPTHVHRVLHDAVVGTEIVLWFATEGEPIGIHLNPFEAADIGKRLFDLISLIE